MGHEVVRGGSGAGPQVISCQRGKTKPPQLVPRNALESCKFGAAFSELFFATGAAAAARRG